MSLCTIVRMVLFLPLAMSALAQPFTAQKTTADGIPVVRLNDNERGMVVSIAPTVGNNAYEMIVGGRNIFWFPYESVADFAREPKLCGNPFLAPWANRLDEEGFYFEGRRYLLDKHLGNLLRDGNGLSVGEDGHTQGLADAVRKHGHPADDLIGVAGVGPGANMKLDSLIEIGGGGLLDQFSRFGG